MATDMTEAGQISELKKELQQQQEQINLLKTSSSGFMKKVERVLIYGLILLCAFPSVLLWMIYLGNRFNL